MCIAFGKALAASRGLLYIPMIFFIACDPIAFEDATNAINYSSDYQKLESLDIACSSSRISYRSMWND